MLHPARSSSSSPRHLAFRAPHNVWVSTPFHSLALSSGGASTVISSVFRSVTVRDRCGQDWTFRHAFSNEGEIDQPVRGGHRSRAVRVFTRLRSLVLLAHKLHLAFLQWLAGCQCHWRSQRIVMCFAPRTDPGSTSSKTSCHRSVCSASSVVVVSSSHPEQRPPRWSSEDGTTLSATSLMFSGDSLTRSTSKS